MTMILMAAVEGLPFGGSGETAEVIGALAGCFKKDGYDVRLILPGGPVPREGEAETAKFYTTVREVREETCITEKCEDGITCYFVHSDRYLKRYSMQSPGGSAFFSIAVTEALKTLNIRPDIIHCHNWQTALIPVLLKTVLKDDPYYSGIKTMFTLHSLTSSGYMEPGQFSHFTGIPEERITEENLLFGTGISFLKGGLYYADRITTAGKTYAEDIKTPSFGLGLDNLLLEKSGVLYGIMNGIDTKKYDPSSDPCIQSKYSAASFRRNRGANRRALLQKLGLPENCPDMLICTLSELNDKKGVNLIAYMIEEICRTGVHLIMTGRGDEIYEQLFSHCASVMPENVSYIAEPDEETEKLLLAGCDAVLVPSPFEPGGSVHLKAMRYGALPIVHSTGALKDAVKQYNENEESGTGFSFNNFNAHEMLGCIRYAKRIYSENRRGWNRIVSRAMKADNSWERSAAEYERLFEEISLTAGEND